ncbi:MAG: hypothetical protein JXR95_06445 [Deltaproteobacteria bacterium]|nr:hypothetical protein [Deltaproteobacteria bacterium]
MFLDLIFSVFISLLPSQSQFEILGGGGLHSGNPSFSGEIGFDTVEKNLGLGITVPFTWSYYDKEVNFRKRMWDEPGDFAAAIRYLSWRGVSKDVRAAIRLGYESDITIGYMVRHLNNLIMMDHLVSGLRTEVVGDYFDFSGFLNNFVSPEWGGLSAGTKFYDFSLKVNFFMDSAAVKRMANPLGVVSMDYEKGFIVPWETSNLYIYSTSLGYKLTQWLEIGVEGSTFEPGDPESYGGTVFAEFKGKKGKFAFRGNIFGGKGGNGFIPVAVGPFYMMRRNFHNLEDGDSILVTSRQHNTSAQSAGCDFSIGYGEKFNISAGVKTYNSSYVAQLSTLFFVENSFQISFYGAFSDSYNWVSGLEMRYSVSKPVFVYLRASRQYTLLVDDENYSMQTAVFAGIGGNLRLE